MTNDARSELKRDLGEDLAVLDAMSDEDAADFLVLFKEARVEETKSLDASIDATINALPWVFRGPARKIMFGGKK
ncbi:hypothetical protein [Antrihabitans sp. YC2-6]|uniref:hypothetical protein n=1 Tax=Antrihabitans sp. YC2-6 TaxID=2799498 RepID=UPI0018F38C4D|nr:hypothetical protein [Antrihabitans sp. YC2-6]MBJ8344192.1 hypothetical protein [Antrihabitans sp. YC2-6]